MTIWPSLTAIALATVLALSTPVSSRNGHTLLTTALEHGPDSRQMLALVLFWAGAVTWGVAAAIRSRTTLLTRPGRSPVLDVRTTFRRRTVDLADVRQVRLFTVASGSRTRQIAALLDSDGRVVATPPYHRGIWTRADAVDLLRGAGVSVAYEHRLSRPSEIEAAHPRTTTWADRHPAAVIALLAAATGPVVLGFVWFFDLG